MKRGESSPIAGNDPLQPYAVCIAVCTVGGAHGVDRKCAELAAGGRFDWLDLLGILACMVFARSTAMAFNRIADRKLDALNPRTQTRHLPGGVLSVGSVVLFTALCAAGFVAGTLLFLPHNWIPLYASIPVLLFLMGYSYAKRFTLLSHFWLGAALMLAPLAAWVAIRAEISAAPLVLGGAVLFWVAGFDIIYACQDFDFDVKMRFAQHSRPIRRSCGAAYRRFLPSADGRLAFDVAAGISLLGANIFNRYCGYRRIIILRTPNRPARRSYPGQSGVFPCQRRSQRGIVGDRGGRFGMVKFRLEAGYYRMSEEL